MFSSFFFVNLDLSLSMLHIDYSQSHHPRYGSSEAKVCKITSKYYQKEPRKAKESNKLRLTSNSVHSLVKLTFI